jgi:serine/threonine kinase 16
MNDSITFEDGRRVIPCRQIAEGGFGCVFLARDAGISKKVLYALKKIECNNKEAIEQCRKEASIHRMFNHENIMPLLGMKFETSTKHCFMLFPYIRLSLHDDIMARHLLEDTAESNRSPYSETEALTLFSKIVDAVETLHGAGISHRDIKPENILLTKRDKHLKCSTPVLMDFGSAGTLTEALHSWPDIIKMTEKAALHTTIQYRAPELFGGGNQYGPTQVIHYDKADIWSLGCVLFAMLYGSSPFEIEWRVSLVEGAAAEGTARIVECTYPKVLEPVPFPPDGSAADRRYDSDPNELIEWILRHKVTERPSCFEISKRLQKMVLEHID